MKLAILSGKGGTGKTTLAVHLAQWFSEERHREVLLVDCDIEEPNDFLFLPADSCRETPWTIRYPVVREADCLHCRKCALFCRFHAILATPSLTLVLPENCHDCGGCAFVCPARAISYREREMGTFSECTGLSAVSVSEAANGGSKLHPLKHLGLRTARLNVGEFSGVRGIRQMIRKAEQESDFIIMDGAPGSSCNASACAESADALLLVSEPTPFGVSDLKAVVEMGRRLGKACAVVVNKSESEHNRLTDYARAEGLPIAGRIPFSFDIAAALAKGESLLLQSAYRGIFDAIGRQVEELWGIH